MSWQRKLLRKQNQKNLQLASRGEKEKRPKVFLGVPLLDTIFPETSTCFTNLAISVLTSGFDYAHRFKQSANVHTNRNNCVRAAYETDSTHLLFIDTDMIFPDGVRGNGQGSIIQQLLAHDKDIIGALCVRKKRPCMPTIANWDEEKQWFVNILDWPKDALIEVDGIGTGILLIKMEVFDSISDMFFKGMPFKDHGWFSAYRVERPDTVKELGTDYSFCRRAKQAGHKIYCDTSIPIGHIGRYTYTINDYLAHQEDVIKHNEKSAPETIPLTKARLVDGGSTEEPSIRDWINRNYQEDGE